MSHTIFMIGDSIMQTNKFDTFPQTGWGQVLNLFTKDDVSVINLAKNGTSSKSFLEQNRFEYVENNIKCGDLLIIGFAHNDEKSYDPLRYTAPYDTFTKNLLYFSEIALKNKAHVVLLTPIIRRNYVNGKLVDTHGEYVDAILKCASKQELPFVDLNALTTEFFSKCKEEDSKRYFMNFAPCLYDNYPNGRKDDSHLCYDGAVLIAKLFVNEVFKKNYSFKSLFNEFKNSAYCADDTYEK